MSKEFSDELERFIEHNGKAPLRKFMREYERPGGGVLTILVNEGSHHIPSQFLKGEVWTLMKGSVSLESKSFESYLRQRLLLLAKVLKARQWKSIFIVPTGHPVLSMNVMLLVFRVTRLEATIVGYFGEDGYRLIQIPQRPILDKTLEA